MVLMKAIVTVRSINWDIMELWSFGAVSRSIILERLNKVHILYDYVEHVYTQIGGTL